MRRALVALHVVALAVWLGSGAFAAGNAGLLFSLARPTCPACLHATTGQEGLLACAACGALHHAACAPRGCGLEHEGPHALGAAAAVAATSSPSRTTLFARVRLRDESAPPERRLLFRLEAATPALDPARGEVPGACFELPRAAAGDAAARGFQLAQVLGLACSVLAFLTVLPTPPGGALRLLRALTIAGAIGLGAWSATLAHEIAARRLATEQVALAPEAREAARKDFGRTHGASSAVAVGELLLVLVALTLATTTRAPAPPPS